MVQEVKPIIENAVHFVFVPVSNMSRAVNFYSIILGLPLKPETYGSLYNLDIHSPNIVLDSNLEEDFVPCKHPLFSFKAENLEDARTVITRAGGEVGDIVSFGDTSFFVFADLDGNRIMVVNN